jgi:hypothetical protein
MEVGKLLLLLGVYFFFLLAHFAVLADLRKKEPRAALIAIALGGFMLGGICLLVNLSGSWPD